MKTELNSLPPEKVENEKTTVEVALHPCVNAAAILAEYTNNDFGQQDMVALTKTLAESMKPVLQGDMNACEAMLFSQATALQAIFMNLSLKAAKQEYLTHHESFLRLALKAQNQCRATLETLSAIKNPSYVFAKQANIAHGMQQVNNGQLNKD